MSRTAAITAKQMQLFKDMVNNGVAPEDIAKTFNIAISSVHNYKKKLKVEGVSFPNVRGQRPKGNIDGFIELYRNLTSEGPSDVEVASTKSPKLIHEDQGFKITINGIRFVISPEAKEIHINGKDSIEVNF